jgi:hypothetical protein
MKNRQAAHEEALDLVSRDGANVVVVRVWGN